MSNITDNPKIQVLKAGGSGVFTNYIYKAIPLAFDESMSYYETLAGLRDYLEETVIPTVNNNAEAVAELQGLYEELNKYVDDYFKNLDVQEEINNKLDDLVRDGTLTNIISTYVQPLINEQNQEIAEFKTSVNGQIASQNAQIQAITSGSPLVASSVQGMTDTTRVYVNTTDGKWYYYNGNAWTIGGIYQATEIEDGSVTPEKTNFIKVSKIGNLINFSTLTKNFLINADHPNGSVSNNWYTTDFIEIDNNLDLKSSRDTGYFNWYNQNKEYISTTFHSDFTTIDFVIPENTKYCRVSFLARAIDNIVFFYPDYYIGTYDPLTNKWSYISILYQLKENTKVDTENIIEKSITEDLLNDELKAKINAIVSDDTYFNDKKIMFLGDSITWGYDGNNPNTQVTEPIPLVVKNLLKSLTNYNYGSNGSTLSGDNISYGYSSMVTRVNNINIDDIDYFIVWGGTNDFGSDRKVPLGTSTDNNINTFYGSMNTIIPEIINKYPTTRIAFITPLKRVGDDTPNTFGFILSDYVNAIKDVCEKYSIPYLDLYNMSGCYPSNNNFKINNLPDGLHPNQAYYYVLAKKISEFIKGL